MKLEFLDDSICEDLDLINGEEFEVEDGYDQSIADSFAEDFMSFLNYFISKSNAFQEDFVSDSCFRNHFEKHCIGRNRDRTSTRGRILYDFRDPSQYSEYEKSVTDKILSTRFKVGSLYDYDGILKFMRKLFSGNTTVQFCNSCGLDNNGIISISFISYSSNVTTNYRGGNTIDICIKNATGKTVSLYAVDAHDVQNRLNNTVSRYSEYDDVEPYTFNNT